MNVPTVLLYNLEGSRGMAIKTMCLTMKVRVKSVSQDDYGQTLAALLGLEEKADKAVTGESVSQEMLVMAGFSREMLNRFLQGFRKKKIPPVKLKAMVTPTNLGWDSFKLYEELLAEHNAMTAGEAAHGESD